MAGGNGDAVVAGVEHLVLFCNDEAGVGGRAVVADAVAEQDAAAAVALLLRVDRVAAADEVVVDAQRTFGAAAGHVDVDVVLNPRLARLVNHLVPRDLAAGEMTDLVELRELYEIEAIAVAAFAVTA